MVQNNICVVRLNESLLYQAVQNKIYAYTIVDKLLNNSIYICFSSGIDPFVRDCYDIFAMVYNCCHLMATIHRFVVIHYAFVIRPAMVEAVERQHIVFPSNNGTRGNTRYRLSRQQGPSHGKDTFWKI